MCGDWLRSGEPMAKVQIQANKYERIDINFRSMVSYLNFKSFTDTSII